MKKQTKIILIIITVVLAITYAYAKLKKTNNGPNYTSNSDVKDAWLAKYPQLKTIDKQIISDSNRVSEDKSSTKLPNTVVTQDNLIGTITNSFGIRDDILNYIILNVPQNNLRALMAAIKLAINKQKIYYGNVSQEEAVKLAGKNILIKTCLAMYMKNNKNFELTRGMDNLLRDTKARDSHLWDVDNSFFAYRALSTGMSVAEEELACNKGDF